MASRKVDGERKKADRVVLLDAALSTLVVSAVD